MNESSKQKKVVVIGGGPGGYSAAFLAADLGMEAILVDLEENPGGVCLYRGCIPSKALLHGAGVISEAKDAETFGITFSSPNIDLGKLREWKNGIVGKLTGGLGALSKKRKVRLIRGRARFLDNKSIKVAMDVGEEIISFDNAIIATGSRPMTLPYAPSTPNIWDSTDALNLPEIPGSLLIVGGGYIGLELGTVYSKLGSKVTVVEASANLLAGADRDVARILEKRAVSLFDKIFLSTGVEHLEDKGEGVTVVMRDDKQEKIVHQYDRVLVAIGRRPNSEDLGLENTRVRRMESGFIEVDQSMQTHEESIYAIGDVVGQPMLAHKASHEGRIAVENIAGTKSIFQPMAIPAVVYTDPEAAWCGLTENVAKETGVDYKIVKFPWGASGRALTLNRTDGFTKLIVEASSGRILGVGIVGPGAGELIAEGVLAMEMGANVDDVRFSIHPHPTLSETVMETAESFFGQSTHYIRSK